MIETIADSITEGRSVPGITIARVDKALYVVDGHARVSAYQRVEVEEITVSEVLRLAGKVDVVIEHVRRNLRSSLNPFKVAAAVTFLERAGIKDPYDTLGLSPVMSASVRVIRSWPAELCNRASQMFEGQTRKFSDLHIAPHFFTAFEELTAKIQNGDANAEGELRNIVEYILHYLEGIRDANSFTLPGTDQVNSIIRGRKQRIAAMSAVMGSVAARETASADDSDEGADDDRHGHDRKGIPEKRARKPVFMPDKNKSRIQCIDCGKPQVVDLKTGHACRLEEVQGGAIEVIRDGNGHRAFMLGPEIVKMLGLEAAAEDPDMAARGYRILTTDKKSDAERMIRSASSNARFVIMVSEMEAI